MTDQESGGEARATDGMKLEADALVDRVTSGDAIPKPVVVLTGLLGRSGSEGVWRLYLSQLFDEYVEFDASDVVYQQAASDADPLAGTKVWVRAGASLQYTQVSSRQVQADFLQGGITAKHLSSAGAPSFSAMARSETGYACTRNYVCSTNPHIPACQERTEVCGSIDCNPSAAFCPTGVFIKGC